MSKIGAVIEGKYVIARLIGQGGMGAVYEAHHQVIGRRVAIKFLHAQYANNPQVIQRFVQEAQIAGSLGHPNICEVTDIGRTPEGEPYMLMPLLNGRSLAEEMKASKGGLPSERVFDIVYQVLSALQRAHAEGIVHRDLKPDNIFLARLGDRQDFVKILDFGISKILTAGGEGAGGLTSTGMVLGTPYYMAPEQARGAKNIDHRVDIHAVGVILYELLTGRLPYEAESYNEIIVKIVTEPFKPPRAHRSDIPVAVERVILKAMAKAPDERFSSARDFKHALFDRVRDSELRLPAYLTRVDLTGEIDTLDPGELDPGELDPGELDQASGKKTRRRLLAGGGIAGILVAGAVTLLLIKPWNVPSPVKPHHKQSATSATVPADAGAVGVRTLPLHDNSGRRVTVRFLGLPDGGKLVLDGKPVKDGRARVPHAAHKLHFRATAPGGLVHEGWVTPDQDRLVLLHLHSPPNPMASRVHSNGTVSKATRHSSMQANRHPPSSVTPRVNSKASPHSAIRTTRPQLPAGRISAAPPRRRARRTVVKGRAGTVLDGDYDED